MNDQHPHAGYVGDDTYATGSFQTGGYDTNSYDTNSYATGAYDTGSYATGAYDTSAYAADPLYATHTQHTLGGYDAGHSGQYDTTQWATAADTATATQQWDTSGYATGQWDASAWNQTLEAQQASPAEQFATTSYDTTTATGQWYTGGFDTGAYDATAWNYAPEAAAEAAPPETFVPQQYDYAGVEDQLAAETAAEAEPEPHSAAYDSATPEGAAHDGDYAADQDSDYAGEHDWDDGGDYAASHDAEHDGDSDPSTEIAEPVAPPAPTASPRRAGGSRGRRRTPPRRSALLTVAVPSVCVMGVAGIAAASVSGLTDTEKKDDSASVAADDPSAVKPAVANKALDTQLAALDVGARDFGDRASRTQERIDLKARQEAERKKRAEEAARREAMRPKYALPVDLHRLSARYGQAGINWMSLHTGIDFPVQYGTPVKAATDGTVRTQWNSAYGNMVIVTAADGTETWYCHLSSAKIRSGPVKAGDVIAYSGNSGNSTGPHLHFEVRPGGGAAIDPEAWLRGHGLSPTG